MLVNTTLMRREMMVSYVSRGERGKTKGEMGGRKREAKYSPLSLGCRKEMSS